MQNFNDYMKYKGSLYVYCYQCITNGKVYIGQTNDPKTRDWQHSKGEGQVIDCAIAKYGRENFLYWIVEIVSTDEELNEAEIFWIAEMRAQLGRENVYNISDGGKYGMRGHSHSEELKKRLSEIAMGKPGTNKGKHFSQEWRNRLSVSNSNREYKARRRFNDEQAKEISRLYVEEKKSMYFIGNKYDCGRRMILDILTRYGISQRDSNYRGHKNGKNLFTEEQELEICEIYKTNTVNKNDLSKTYNCSAHTIKDILIRHNVSTKLNLKGK